MAEIKLKLVIDGKEAIATLDLTQKEINELTGGFIKAKDSSKSFTENINDSLSNARNSIQGLKEVFSVFRSMFEQPVRAAIDIEQTETSFNVLIGNTEKAKAFLEDLKEYGAKTPFTLPHLTEAAQTMLGFGITAQDTSNYIKMLGDISGGNAQKLQSLSLAFSQIQSTGRLMGQDLLQLINGGFNPLKVISEQTGKSMGQLKKDMEDGKISADDVTNAMKTATQEGGLYYGMLEKQSQTLGGQLSNLEDSFIKVQQSIGAVAGQALRPLIYVIQRVTDGLTNFSPVLTGIVGTVGTFTAALVTLHTTGMLKNIQSLLAMRVSVAANTGAFAGLTVSLTTSAGAYSTFTVSIRTATAAVKGFLASNPIGWAILGITAIWGIIEALDLFSEKTDEAKEKQKQYLDGLSYAKLKDEYRQLGTLQQNTQSRIYQIQSEINALQNTDVKGKEQASKVVEQIKEKQSEIKGLQQTINNLSDYSLQVRTKLLEKEKEMTAEIDRQVQAIDDRLDKLGKSEKDQKLIDLKKQYESDKAVLELAKVGKDKLKQLDDWYQAEKDKINADEIRKNKEKNDGIVQQEKQVNEQIAQVLQELQLEKGNDLEDELLKLDNWYMDKYEIIKNNEEALTELRQIYADKQQALMGTAYLLPIPKDAPEPKELVTPEGLGEVGDVKSYKKLSPMEEVKAWQDSEIAKTELYGNSAEMRIAIEEEAGRRIAEIEEQTQQAKQQAIMSSLSFIAQGIGKHTALGKAAAAAMAYMNTSEAVTKALTAGPILGPILGGIIAAMGAVQIGKILSTQTPGYALGGRLEQGKSGFIEGYHNEIIAPERTFVDIMRTELIPKVVTSSPVIQNNNLEKLFERQLQKLDNWQSNLTFKLERGDLYSSWEQEQNFRTRHAT
jgi:tape measure domain-containing protein